MRIKLILISLAGLMAFFIATPASATKFIKNDATGGDCNLIGDWDFNSKTCTLITDLNETLQIDDDGITLDGNSHTITGDYTGYGVFLPVKKDTVVKNLTVKHFSYGINLSHSSGNIIVNNNASDNFLGIVLWSLNTNNTLTENTVSNNYIGIYLVDSDKNTLVDNITSNNINSGIALVNLSNNNTLADNDVLDNEFEGIVFLHSENNNLTGNLISGGNNSGISSVSSNNNIFDNNIISNNVNYGFLLHNSSGNILTKNTILDNNLGVSLGQYSSYNQIYNNNFVDNLIQADVWASYNIFNLDKPTGGNYWSEYDTPAEGCNDANNDGFCDNPYLIPGASGGQDNYPFVKENGWEVPAEPEKWSFAIITDLHIGWAIPDYDSKGYNDNDEGQNYYITKRLEKTIEWINNNYIGQNIKFVAVLGDISDTAEYSEFVTAREILNGLEIPYIPIIGNHDIWPYIQKPTIDPDKRAQSVKDRRKNGEPLGDEYFEQLFWQDNLVNVQKIENLFSDFERQEELSKNAGAPYFQNYSFNYEKINFVALDFASRNYNDLMKLPLNTNNYPETLNWFEEKIDNHDEEKFFVFTHYPFKILGDGIFDFAIGFWPNDRKEISDAIRDCNCTVFNVAGHTHINATTSIGEEYEVVETEPISQISTYPWYALTNKPIRIVQVNENVIKEINYDNLYGNFSPTINPYFTISPGEVGAGQEITFRAYTKNQKPEKISSYDWDFGNEETTNGSLAKKTYQNPGTYEVSLNVTDIYGNSEELSWNLEVGAKVKSPFKIFLPFPNLVPFLNGDVDLTQQANAQNTEEWVDIIKFASPRKLVGAINIHFEEATENINLSGLIADTDLITRKSVLHMDVWPDEIDEEKILYIPSTGSGGVYICPHAISLNEVTLQCEDIKIFNTGEEKDNIFVDTTIYDDQEYYMIYGITGTGGGELDDEQGNDMNLETQIAITGMIYGGNDILSDVTADVGDGNTPLLLSELKSATVDLESYMPEGKLNPGETRKLKMKFKFLETAGNEYQGKSINVKFKFEALQEK